MSGETRYRFLEPSDSEACARLLAKNRFFFGSLDPELSAERYDLVQKMKGLVFGVCAEIDSEVIAMLCTYRAGADRNANPHQLFVSALLVDAAYRTKLYSFMQLYRMMLVRVAETMPWIRELVMEIYSENLPSLYMQRMFGSVIVDPEMPNPEELFMRNFGPSLQRTFRPMWEVTHQKMEGVLPPFDKKKVKDPTPLTEGRLVPVTNIVNGYTMTMFCNLYSGCVCRIRSEEGFYAGLEGDGFFVENLSDHEQTWSIIPHGTAASEKEKITVRLKDGERVHLDKTVLPALSGQHSGEDGKAGGAVFMLEGTTNIFLLKAGEDWKKDLYNPEPAGQPGSGTFSLKERTGLLSASDGGRVCFQELWPYVTSPYLFGTVVPDPERKLSVQSAESGESVVSELRRGFRLERRYTIAGGEASVQTAAFAEGGSEEEFDPAFALHLQDMNGSVEFIPASGETVRKTFDYVRDLKIAHDEVILYQFVREPYSEQELSKIILNFEGSAWEITADRPFRAYLHSNFIFLRPIGWTWEDRKAEFGSIHIRRAEN